MTQTSPFSKSWFARTAALAAVVFSATPSLAEEGDARFSFHEVNVLGTSMDLVIIAAGKDSAESARTAVLAEVERLAKALSTYESTAELARLNAAPVGEAVKVSPEVREVLKLYESWQERTGGVYTAGAGTLAALWSEAQKPELVPDVAAVAERAKLARGKLWQVEDAGGTVKRLVEVPLNVDSLGKGFIVSRAATAAMKVSSVSGVMLNIGGDIATAGTAEPGRKVKWSVQVADPRQPAGKPLSELRISDLSVATSGSYERGYSIAGKEYSHLLDPRTGWPVEAAALEGRAVLGATVIAPDNAVANALATTLCLLSVDEGLKLVKGVPGAGCLLVLADGSRIRSEMYRRHEAPRDDAPLDQSTIATADGPRWPAGHGVKVNWELKPLSERPAERGYVAVWVEDSNGQHVTTVAVWGNNKRWLSSMKGWWKHGKTDGELVTSTTRATRPAGKYEVQWDGRDRAGRAVPAGTYTVWVETCFEHGGHVLRSAAIDCAEAPDVARIASSSHYDGVRVEYGPLGEVRVGAK
jgi:thiamine biosynthesis lipoprotein ApbE